MRKVILIVFSLALAFGSSGAFGQTNSHVQVQYDDFYQFIHNLNSLDTLNQGARAQRIQDKYDQKFGILFRSDDLGSLPKEDLHLLFDAASLASFENPEGSSYKDALMALHSLGPDASDREIRSTQGMLFQARKFHELDALGTRYASRGLAEPPKFEAQASAGMHKVLVASGKQLTTKMVDIGQGPRIVVVAHPLCHFTQDAMKTIEENPHLKEVMRKNAVWIAPPDRNMDFTAFSKWRNAYPEAPIFTAYGYSSWPELGEWGTPTFYFFEDGKLVDTLVGWPKGGRMDELEMGLAKIGLKVK